MVDHLTDTGHTFLLSNSTDMLLWQYVAGMSEGEADRTALWHLKKTNKQKNVWCGVADSGSPFLFGCLFF